MNHQDLKTFEDILAAAKANPELYKHLLPADTILEDFVKYPGHRVELIAAVLNEGWVPDWDNYDEYKYFPYFDMSNGFSFRVCVSRSQYSYVGSRLCFKSSVLAKYAGQQFTKEYKDYYIINRVSV